MLVLYQFNLVKQLVWPSVISRRNFPLRSGSKRLPSRGHSFALLVALSDSLFHIGEKIVKMKDHAFVVLPCECPDLAIPQYCHAHEWRKVPFSPSKSLCIHLPAAAPGSVHSLDSPVKSEHTALIATVSLQE
jgi:hypothetical protein